MRVEERQGQTTATADQILGEIRDYCRATRTAESTFGRRVVNDGKLVSRLRDGARTPPAPLDRARAFLPEYRGASPPAPSTLPPPAGESLNGAAVPAAAPAGF